MLPLQILQFDVSTKAMSLPKQMLIAYATDPPKATMTARPSQNQQPSMRTPGRVGKSAHSYANSGENGTDTTCAKEGDVTSDGAGAIHYKLSINKELLVRQHVRIRQN